MSEHLPKAHIVYCKSRMFLDRGDFASWRDVQDAYEDYMASLGPSTEAEIIEFLRDDFGTDDSRWPFTRQAIADFFRSTCVHLQCIDARIGEIS